MSVFVQFQVGQSVEVLKAHLLSEEEVESLDGLELFLKPYFEEEAKGLEEDPRQHLLFQGLMLAVKL